MTEETIEIPKWVIDDPKYTPSGFKVSVNIDMDCDVVAEAYVKYGDRFKEVMADVIRDYVENDSELK